MRLHDPLVSRYHTQVFPSGDASPEGAEESTQLGTDVFISTARRKPAESGSGAAPTCCAVDDARARMRRKLQTDVGKETYRRRKAVVEPVFGQVKEARGFRRFLL